MPGRKLDTDGLEAVDQVPCTFPIVIYDGPKESGHEQEHDKLFENAGKLIPVQRRLDAENQ